MKTCKEIIVFFVEAYSRYNVSSPTKDFLRFFWQTDNFSQKMGFKKRDTT